MPTYPYTSGAQAVVKTLDQLRKSFPAKVDAAYLQRFQIAPSNESYVIGIIRFLGLIDDEGNRQDDKIDFFHGSDVKFQAGMDALLREAYAELFAEMGEEAYKSERDSLGYWFRGADKTSDLVGKRQAGTFLALASSAGKAEAAPARTSASTPRPRAASPAIGSTIKKAKASKATTSDATTPVQVPPGDTRTDVGLTVRIEVNLPAGGDADTYDAIFASIKRHLIP